MDINAPPIEENSQSGNNKPATQPLRATFKRVSYIVTTKSAVKVLVIEDDKLARMMLCKVLRSQKFITIEAPNGELGLKLFIQEKPDMILTDILMPDKEGLETIMDIRALDADVPIVAMSGGGFDRNMDFLKMAGRLGATRTLTKPIRPDDILSLMSGLGLNAEWGSSRVYSPLG